MTRTITKRDVQCVQCGDWLEEWEIHPESDTWMFCIPCGEKFFHGSDLLGQEPAPTYMINQPVQAINIHCPSCQTDTLTKQCYGCGGKVCVYCGFMQVTKWFCADCWYNGYEKPYHEKVQQDNSLRAREKRSFDKALADSLAQEQGKKEKIMTSRQRNVQSACPVCGASLPHTTPMAREYHENVTHRSQERELPTVLIDFTATRAFLARVVKHYEESAPTVSRWADDLYIRLGEDVDTVRVGELVAAQNLFLDEWEHAHLAANRIYKLMDRLGQDTSGHLGY